MKKLLLFILLSLSINSGAQVAHVLHGTQIDNSQFIVGNVIYGSQWCNYVSQSAVDALGIKTLTIIYPALSAGQKYSGFTDDTIALTRTYVVVNKTAIDSPAYPYPIPPSCVNRWNRAADSIDVALGRSMIPGATGAQGIQGIQGVQGIKGDKGDVGNTGAQGIQGLTGNTGSQGIQGITGNAGSQGIQGVAGPNNVTTSTTTNLTGFIKGNGSVISVDNTAYYPLANPNGFTSNTGTVTSVTAGTGLSGGTFTTSGTVSMPNTGTAATNGTSTLIPVFVTDAQGRVTSNTNTAIGTLNQNTTGTASNVTNPISFANGGATGSAATAATTGTMTVNMTTAVITITPTGACTFNAANGGIIGQEVTFVITTSGVSSFVLTFGTNFKSTGTLTTGTTTGKMFAFTFRCYATNLWTETSRTIAQ